jgi:hypothetical protein
MQAPPSLRAIAKKSSETLIFGAILDCFAPARNDASPAVRQAKW